MPDFRPAEQVEVAALKDQKQALNVSLKRMIVHVFSHAAQVLSSLDF
jgi:hypothetical protein